MKLRIKGDSLRLRLSPSEVARLMATGHVEETIHFGPEENAKLTYALQLSPQKKGIDIRYEGHEVSIVVSTIAAKEWAEGSQVGMYGDIPLENGRLELMIEKDFACLDRSDAENQDRFPHPKRGAVC